MGIILLSRVSAIAMLVLAATNMYIGIRSTTLSRYRGGPQFTGFVQHWYGHILALSVVTKWGRVVVVWRWRLYYDYDVEQGDMISALLPLLMWGNRICVSDVYDRLYADKGKSLGRVIFGRRDIVSDSVLPVIQKEKLLTQVRLSVVEISSQVHAYSHFIYQIVILRLLNGAFWHRHSAFNFRGLFCIVVTTRNDDVTVNLVYVVVANLNSQLHVHELESQSRNLRSFKMLWFIWGLFKWSIIILLRDWVYFHYYTFQCQLSVG